MTTIIMRWVIALAFIDLVLWMVGASWGQILFATVAIPASWYLVDLLRT